MQHGARSAAGPLIGLALLGLTGSGCEDPPPGDLDFVVTRHETALTPGTSFDMDLQGDLYVCLFRKGQDPFVPEGKGAAQHTRVVRSTNFGIKGATVVGADPATGLAAFTKLAAGSAFSMVVFLDDDGNNAVMACTNAAGEIQVSEKDPLWVRDTDPIPSNDKMVVEVILDHRRMERIR